MRLFSWLIGFPLAVVAALFAVSNKGATTFALWPLPFTVEAPLYLATLIALVAGFVVGGFIALAEKKLAEKTAPVSGEPNASVGALPAPGAVIGAAKPALSSPTVH